MEQFQKEFLKPDEMASILGVSKETLRLWRVQGIIPYLRIRNTIRFWGPDVVREPLGVK